VVESPLASLAGEGDVARVVELARRHLDMDLGFLTEFSDGHQVYRGLAGDAASFGWELGGTLPLSESYCQRMAAGELSSAIPSTDDDQVARQLPVTRAAGIGSYVGVPVVLPDGSVFGSLCAVSHQPREVDAKDARFLALLAELVAVDVQRQRQRDAERMRVRDLIDLGGLEVALQPIVGFAAGRVVGVEALSRFPPGSGSPDTVFRAAHAVGLGMELERLAVRTALRLIALLPPDAYLAINLTPAVAVELALQAEGRDLPLDRMVLEITEHAAVESYSLLRDRLSGPRRRGLRLAIDDAGAGFASLHHIVELAPDIIKIDRSLVEGVAEDQARRSVVRAFVALAADLGACVVAEGVELAAELDTVRQLGVEAAQGYLLARPSTDREELASWFAGSLLAQDESKRPVAGAPAA
jgi:EAL domain-containing protein (putative c-di-GMP-specific phosphodiesterase class I)